MWIFDSHTTRGLALGAALATSACAPATTDTCIRYSDCLEGYTCSQGYCVIPPVPSTSEGGASEGGTSGAASGSTDADASVDAALAIASSDANAMSADGAEASVAADASEDGRPDTGASGPQSADGGVTDGAAATTDN